MKQSMDNVDHRFSRRSFLQKVGALGAMGAGAGLLAACGGQEGGASAEGGFTCTDTAGLPQQAVQMRTSLGYIDTSATPEQWCHNCAFFQAAAQGSQCGGCQLIQGPIHPDGWCRSWAAKPAPGA